MANLSTQSAGDLITAAIYNAVINRINLLGNMQINGTAIQDLSAASDFAQLIRQANNPTGELKYIAATAGAIDTNVYLLADGETIGSGSSGATRRANADMETLFSYLWDNFSNTELPIQDSSGVATTRGASASADFSADKRLPLPDMRGRAPVGMDNPTGGSAANRITSAWSDSLGGSGGSETHTLTEAELASHNHPIKFLNDTVVTGGNLRADATPGNPTTSNIALDTGSDSPHNNIQPSAAMGNFYVYTGN